MVHILTSLFLCSASFLHQIEGWDRADIQIEPIHGGLTNQNFIAHADGTSCFVRWSGEKNEPLGSSFAREWDCASQASNLGIAPPIIHYMPEHKVLVSRYIPTSREIDPCDPQSMKKYCALIRKFHTSSVQLMMAIGFGWSTGNMQLWAILFSIWPP